MTARMDAAAAAAAAAPPHLLHSHAHEQVPGTVDMRAAEGDETAYGLALYPVPAQDPNDPLQWSKAKKTLILITVSLYSFLSNTALLGPSVYIQLFSEMWHISPADASGLISYPNLAYGFGSLILIPMYHKFGRRPIMLLSLLIYAGGLIGASRASSFAGLMTARVFHAFGSSVCEALPAQVVNDIFFLHERGKRLGYYTLALCFGATGPLYAGYMLGGGYSWRLFFYVEFAFAMGLFILAFLCVEETMYHRIPRSPSLTTITSDFEGKPEYGLEMDMKRPCAPPSEIIPPRKTFVQTLKLWGPRDRDSDFWMMIVRSFSYFIVPPVFWVITTYGLYIGLAALVFNYTFPIKITAPPYNWSSTNSGLICVATAVAFALAVPLNSLSDRLAAYRTRRNHFIREAEFRLGILLPVFLLAPAGLVLYGYAAERNLHWFAYFAGVAMVQFNAYFYFTYTLAYAIDSYNANVPEMLIAMNLGKQSISFGIGFYVLDWVVKNGYVTVISGIFTGVLLANNLAVFGFIGFGKRMRVWFVGTWLAKMHKRSIREGEIMTH